MTFMEIEEKVQEKDTVYYDELVELIIQSKVINARDPGIFILIKLINSINRNIKVLFQFAFYWSNRWKAYFGPVQ